MSTVELAVLECSACGSAVPLGDGDVVPCAHCGAAVQVPEAHRALRADEREYTAHRTTAFALLRKLGRPPSLLVRFLAGVGPWTVVLLVSVGALVSGVLYAAFLSLVSRLSLAVFHVHLPDVVLYRYDPTALFVIGQFAFLLASLGTLIVLGAYTRRRGAGLRELQAGLSARPPVRAGGPATCRGCGAPLAANPEALFVTCPYCRADNLLRIPERWIGAARKRTRKLAAAVDEAAHAFEEESRAIRRSLVVRLVVVAMLSGGMLLFLFGVTNAAGLELSTETPYQSIRNGLSRFDWQERVATPSLTLDRNETKGCAGLSCSPLLNAQPCAERHSAPPFVVPAGACDAEACVLHWYVPLRRGDAIEVTADSVPPKTFILLKSHADDASFHHDAANWGTQVPGAFAWLTDGAPARLEPAPYDGWYQLVLGIGAPAVGATMPFCARLER